MSNSSRAYLRGDNLDREDIHQAWEQDNQAWWDWYVSLAENPTAEPSETAPPLPQAEVQDDEALRNELATPYPLTEAQQGFFRKNGYIKLKKVLSAAAVVRLRAELISELTRGFGGSLDGGITDRFLSLEMVWLDNPILREFVLRPRIAKLSADLLGVAAVRLYHDNVLSKEPGCGRTPWHYDATHFPLATDDVLTAWIPAQPIPLAMGPLAFAAPIDVYKQTTEIEFNKFDTSYDRLIDEMFRTRNVTIDDSPFELGEVSFHHNLSFHTARGNRTDRSRIVMATTYFRDGARVVDEPTMISGDWQKFLPGIEPGEVAKSELNPRLWPVESEHG